MPLNEFQYILRFTLQPGHHEQERLHQLITFCQEANIDDVTFIVNGEELNRGHITIAEMKPWLDMLAGAKEKLNQNNIRMSINPWTTFHHADRGRTLKSGQNFTTMVDIQGNKASVQICPLSENWRQYIAEVYRLYAGLKPGILWIEDDFRYHNHAPLVWGGCFCDLHMEEYSKKSGIKLNREEFIKGFLKPGPVNPYRKIWLDTCKDGLLEVAKIIGDAVHMVSPQTKIGLMSSVPWVHCAEGRDWEGILQSLAGNNEMVNRPHLPAYSEIAPQEYLWKFSMVSRLSKAMVPAETVIYPELENFPYTSFSKSFKFIRFQLETSLIINAKGITMNIFDMMGNGILNGDKMAGLLHDSKPFLSKLAGLALLPEKIKGVKVMFDHHSSFTLHTENGLKMDELYPSEYLWAGILTCMGISNTFCTERNVQGNILAISGQYLRNLSGQEIKNLLKNNHIILDGESAYALWKMGFGELAGIKSCKWQECDCGFAALEQVCNGRIYCGVEEARVSIQSMAGSFLEIEYFHNPQVLTEAKNTDGDTVASSMVIQDNNILIFPFGNFTGNPQSLLHPVRQQLIQETLLNWQESKCVIFTKDEPYIGTFFYEMEDKYILVLFNASMDETCAIKVFAPDMKNAENIFGISRDACIPYPVDAASDGEYIIIKEGLKSLELKVFYQKKRVLLPEHCNLYFDEAVKNWDEAIPLGNGLTGCLIWGDGHSLRMSLDRGDLWDTRPAPETQDLNFTYSHLVDLVRDKNQEGIEKLYDKCYLRPTPTKIPAGRLEILYGVSVDNVKSRLDLKSASSEIELIFTGKCSRIKTFLHAVNLFGYIQISGDVEFPEILIKSPAFGVAGDEQSENEISASAGVSNGSLRQLKYPAVEWFEKDHQRWFVQKTAQGMEYGVVLETRENGNTIEAAYYIACSLDGENWMENAKKSVKEALDTGWEKNFESHCKWWDNFWSKSSISLCNAEFEKQWYLTNYLFGSCSRKGVPPLPLQGVWTADNGQLPPWKGDYHHDLNTQMSYYHYLKANHLEEGESFLDFLWNLVPKGREFAGKFFDASGSCLPSVMDIEGGPLGGWPMYSLNLTNQIWLCKAFDDYRKFTGDQQFLIAKAYPYFKETALCVLRWLKPGENGKLELVLSSSPEIHDNSLKAWMSPNSNYDLALLHYLFKTLYEMSCILENGEEDLWKEKRESLSEFVIDNKGRLMVSPDESLQESHRHFAQAMAIHPLRLLDYTKIEDRRIIDATIEQIEELGMRLWVGFSFTWMAELYAIQGNGEAAAFQLKLFWENLCSQNGFHLNGDYKMRGLTSFHYRPFTLESNMCAADALQEMLLQTHNGIIKLFPAIPDKWSKYGTSFTGFRGENGLHISASIKNRKLEFVEIVSEKNTACKVYNSFDSSRLTLQRSGTEEIIDCIRGEIMSIVIRQNESIRIKEEV